jgi:hypothetical protein
MDSSALPVLQCLSEALNAESLKAQGLTKGDIWSSLPDQSLLHLTNIVSELFKRFPSFVAKTKPV